MMVMNSYTKAFIGRRIEKMQTV